MAIGEWTLQNWFDLLSGIGIVGGLVLTAHSLHSETKTRRITNLLALIHNHRELWGDYCRNPNFARVLDSTIDLKNEPLTRDEQLFVGMAVQHLNGVYQAMMSGLTIEPEGLRKDIRAFFSLPIPKAVWTATKLLQNQDFAAFIDSTLK